MRWLGIAIISSSTRLPAYRFLVLTILGIGIPTAWFEDFPGANVKPIPVHTLNMVAHVAEFVLGISHACMPTFGTVFQFASFLGGWQAFLISNKIPNTPTTSNRDW